MTEKRTCPCKKIPWSLSSFSAAEFGDVHSLNKLASSSDHRRREVWNRRDSAGYTPLHLAAQQNHVAATSLLLQMGADVEGKTTTTSSSQEMISLGVATPLHRAAFSGATGTMRILLEHNADLLAKDTSFMDNKTPLHKAASGGRFLAVQLLLDELRRKMILKEGMSMLDSSNSTPLQVAQVLLDRQEEERQSVARWDQIAGGPADWEKCVALLSAAQREIDQQQEQSPVSLTSPLATGSKQRPRATDRKLPPLPPHLQSLSGCLTCQTGGSDNNTCPTMAWQTDLQQRLLQSANQSLDKWFCQEIPNVATATSNPVPEPPLRVRVPATEIQNHTSTIANPQTNAVTTTPATQHKQSAGIHCSSCGKKTVSLYPTGTGGLVCKSCR